MTCQHPGACRCPDFTQIFKHKACQARKPPIPSCASWHQQLSCWTWHSWPESSQYKRRAAYMYMYIKMSDYSDDSNSVTAIWIIAQVYRLSAAHCRVTQYSQRVSVYVTWYSESKNEMYFEKKNLANQMCLATDVRPGRKSFPISAQFEHYSTHDFEIWFGFVKWYQYDPNRNLYHCCVAKMASFSSHTL